MWLQPQPPWAQRGYATPSCGALIHKEDILTEISYTNTFKYSHHISYISLIKKFIEIQFIYPPQFKRCIDKVSYRVAISFTYECSHSY